MNTFRTTGTTSLLLAIAFAAPGTMAADQPMQPPAGQQIDMPGDASASAQTEMQRQLAGKIAGTSIINASGEDIGTVDEIVRDKLTGELHAVASVGGFLGVGSKEVTIPIKDLKIQGENLLAPALASTQEQLKAWPEYAKNAYVEVSDDAPLDLQVAESTSATPMSGRVKEHPSFADLDKDMNGFIDTLEAQDDSQLARQWDQVDTNGDSILNHAEFAAFETMRSEPEGTPQSSGSKQEKTGSMRREPSGSSPSTAY